jgi:hypothetical protein
VLIWREFGVLYNRQYVCTGRNPNFPVGM